MQTQVVLAQPYDLQPDDGRYLDDIRVRLVATNALTGGQMMAGECVNPGPGGPPLHTHHSHDEAYLVLGGRYGFKVRDRTFEGGPGTFVYVPRDTVHTFASLGPDEGRIFCITLPGLDQFLERMSGIAARGGGDEEMAALFADFDSEINGPPLMSA